MNTTIGTIGKYEKVALGHLTRAAGCGIHKHVKRDKKLRRVESKKLVKELVWLR